MDGSLRGEGTKGGIFPDARLSLILTILILKCCLRKLLRHAFTDCYAFDIIAAIQSGNPSSLA
ncbi:hypothetical protein DZC75_12420 [Pseudomonas parafulva]|uniref:Uncharacterized protein n=1 Tax=Pseudomonas parafulva TaxID=157782 RepID=A0AAI8KC26_9PSED|nr:hypothetical protein [Pseudomonas parafulva]AIZ33146.1 hypothetical protein NJ69_09205 [Pseudomonas parafulva]AXO88760.1 hypothetical protein DZC75_12420 [Pseudomonas parafulva]